jgi:hypothetical protein
MEINVFCGKNGGEPRVTKEYTSGKPAPIYHGPTE